MISTLRIAVVGIAVFFGFTATARAIGVEFDILKELGHPIAGAEKTKCFHRPRNFQIVAHACYVVPASEVNRVVAILETDYGHPPLVTHGEAWHGHGEGQVPIPETFFETFKDIANPSELSALIAFTAPAQKSFFLPNLELPDVLPIGSTDGVLYVRLARI